MRVWLVDQALAVVGASEAAGPLDGRGVDVARRARGGTRVEVGGFSARLVTAVGHPAGEGERRVIVVDSSAGASSPLTDRQREIAIRASAGETAPEIAAALQLKPATVRSHLKRTYAALGVTSRAELALAILGEPA